MTRPFLRVFRYCGTLKTSTTTAGPVNPKSCLLVITNSFQYQTRARSRPTVSASSINNLGHTDIHTYIRKKCFIGFPLCYRGHQKRWSLLIFIFCTYRTFFLKRSWAKSVHPLCDSYTSTTYTWESRSINFFFCSKKLDIN